MVQNRGNVRCHFHKGGNIDAETNSKNRCYILDQFKKGCKPLSTSNCSFGRQICYQSCTAKKIRLMYSQK